MPGDTGLKPGEVRWVVGVKDAYRAVTGKDIFNSTEARRWLNAQGFPVSKLPAPVDSLAVARAQAAHPRCAPALPRPSTPP